MRAITNLATLTPPTILSPKPVYPANIRRTPRPDYYLLEVDKPSHLSNRVQPKSRLLISDLDNTLFAPGIHEPEHGVIARPYVMTLLPLIPFEELGADLNLMSYSSAHFSIILYTQSLRGSSPCGHLLAKCGELLSQSFCSNSNRLLFTNSSNS